MGELTARAFTEQNLLNAWHAVRESALEDGEAGPEVERFEAAAARKISKLAEELADGTFEPSPVVRVELAKPSGGTRTLGVPNLLDRIVERALLPELDAVIDPILLPWSFAYRRGLGVKDALACLLEARDAGAGWVARADIEDCFDRIPRWEVLRRLREVVADAAAVDLVRRLMDRPVVGERVRRDDRGLGLHQGSALSPLLCNLYLNEFDRAMLAAGFRVIRYSDDFAIPARDRAEAEQALAEASEALSTLRLELNPAKSQVVPSIPGLPSSEPLSPRPPAPARTPYRIPLRRSCTSTRTVRCCAAEETGWSSSTTVTCCYGSTSAGSGRSSAAAGSG